MCRAERHGVGISNDKMRLRDYDGSFPRAGTVAVAAGAEIGSENLRKTLMAVGRCPGCHLPSDGVRHKPVGDEGEEVNHLDRRHEIASRRLSMLFASNARAWAAPAESDNSQRSDTPDREAGRLRYRLKESADLATRELTRVDIPVRTSVGQTGCQRGLGTSDSASVCCYKRRIKRTWQGQIEYSIVGS